MENNPDKKLTAKQRLFVEAYIINGFNATQAAITAGYSESTAYSQGARLLKNVEIKRELDRLFDEYTMSAQEVLARLTAHARGDLGDVWDESTGQVDWAKARALGKTGLIKRIRHKTTRIEGKDGDTEIFEDEIELHDPQKALQLLGKQHGLFVDRTEVTGKDGDALRIEIVRKPHANDSD